MQTPVRKFLYHVILAFFPAILILADNQNEFFEKKIRPVLTENCYECHNSIKQAKSGLVLDYKEGLLRGGDRGSAISLTSPKSSLLLRVMKHEISDLKMPKGGPRISEQVIKDFEKWISTGAHDPRQTPPTPEQFAQETSWEKIREKRKLWWSFQPIKKVALPSITKKPDKHPVDKFLQHKMTEVGLQPSQPAHPLAVLRRLTFAITGLPPTLEQQSNFINLLPDGIQSAVDKFSDDLLSSPQFGERWARHWMDWVRYADSHGSEGDPSIPNAYRYRNYLIRALNEDIGYDQLIREHIAGDLLNEPRINKELNLNESAIGTAQFRFVLHGFAPTDALDEHVRFTDDQIDAITKTFLGLTVSCARCHHHKFDAISQDDYYALFGILSNGRPAQKVIDDPSIINEYNHKLSTLKHEIKNEFIQSWLQIDIEKKLRNSAKKISSSDEPLDFLLPWKKLNSLEGQEFTKEWQRLKKQVDESNSRLVSHRQNLNKNYWNLGLQETYEKWKKSGVGLNKLSSKSGQFNINFEGEKIIYNIMPAGVYTHLLSTKQNGTLSSPRFKFEKGNLWIRVIGDKGTSVRYSVWNYPRRGTVYPKSSPDPEREKWINFKTDYWAGETGYLEITTNRDHPVEAGNAERSWFGVTEAFHVPHDQPAPRDEVAEILSPLFTTSLPTANSQELTSLYSRVILDTIKSWKNDSMTDVQARILNSLIKQGILPNSAREVPNIKNHVSEYRKIESRIKAPRLAPGLLDGEPFEQALFERGNHKKPAHRVPRRFLEAIDPTPYPEDSVGRLELAQDLLREENPFTSRVIVNRIWHHLFGSGIVRTPDNFGRLGEKPSHPDLLDFLATKFRNDQWSIKSLIKFLVTSENFRLSTKASLATRETDPQNIFLSHSNIRRLEAESIRDALLSTSGRLKLGGVAEGASEGQNSPRRAVYRQIKRNSLDEFLSVFDAPVPSSTKGKRDVTNVPAQSLTLMNDPEVTRAAREFSNLHRNGSLSDRVSKMFTIAMGRKPTQDEISKSIEYIKISIEESKSLNIRLDELRKEVKQINHQISEITEPVRNLMITSRKSFQKDSNNQALQPALNWDFSIGPNDSVHGVKSHLKAGAKIEDGTLHVRNGGYAVTDKIPFDISEKTLSIFLQLDDLKQRAGGAFTIQKIDGSVFDSIVFAEKKPYEWMSGSNSFARTQNFESAPAEKLCHKEYVHIVITYSKNGMIHGYRNGETYGKPYKTKTSKFTANESVVSFGVRHLPATPQRMLHAKIRKASLFNRALTKTEIGALLNPYSYVSENEIIDHLSPEDENKFKNLSSIKAEIVQKIQGLEVLTTNDKPELQDFALALYNMKEFIYLK